MGNKAPPPQPCVIVNKEIGVTHPMPFWKVSKKTWQVDKLIPEMGQSFQTLKFVTYNVWFEVHNFKLRTIELLKLFKQENADFLCLQEVTPEFYQALLEDPFIRDNYYFSGNHVSGYGVLILQKPLPQSLNEIVLPTFMGRTVLYSTTEIHNQQLIVGTVHLESLNPNQELRQEQLAMAYKVLRQAENVILMGDFNFDNEKENQQNIGNNSDYEDIWAKLKPHEAGHTMKKTSRFNSWRPDRVIMKKRYQLRINESQLLTPHSITIIGDQPIPFYAANQPVNPDEVLTPSDHMGLAVVVTVK